MSFFCLLRSLIGMASFILSQNLTFPLSSPSPSSRCPPSSSSSSLIPQIFILPVLQLRRSSFKLCAHLPTRTLQYSNDGEEHPELEPASDSIEIKKKKKKKLRPSFYDQTLERWSLRISSQRSQFPWQEQPETEMKRGEEEEEEGGSSLFSASGLHSDVFFENSRGSHLGSGLSFENPERKFGFNGEENLGGSKGESFDVDEGHLGVQRGNAHWVPSGIPMGAAPWAHGAKSTESLELDEEDEKQNDILVFNELRYSSNSSKLNVDDEEKPDLDRSSALPSRPIVETPPQSETPDHGWSSDELDEEDEKQNDILVFNELRYSSNSSKLNVDDEEKPDLDRSSALPSRPIVETPPQSETPDHGWSSDATNHTMEPSLHRGKSSVSLIVDELMNSLDHDGRSNPDDSISSDEEDNAVASSSGCDIVKLMSPVLLPWERKNGCSNGERLRKRSNTLLAEKTIPEDELRRLRNVALRMKERMKVGPAGVTEAVVESIHRKWKIDEVVKLWFEGPPALHMKRTHETLERKTGGMVIWRSGSSIVLYRGMTYELPCVQSYAKHADTDSSRKTFSSSESSTNGAAVTNKTNGFVKVSNPPDVSMTFFANSSKGSAESFDVDSFLDQLGPRYKDWSGCNPFPVDADMLPGVVPGYTPPFRLLPYKTRSALKNRQMTSLRRLARTMSPHFALGRNRQHQGLARAMVKLWEKSAIAKIAIKRGVPNTCNERMAEEIKKLTGGVLLSRNKEYIVFYRGNNFVTPSVREVLEEKQNLAIVHQDEEEVARFRASALIASNAKTAKGPLLAGTLSETLEANTRWGHQPSREDREKMKRDLALAKHASLVRYLERKLASANAKVRKAERALAKVQEFLDPAELPTDLETVTDEERFLFRQMGLKMRAYLPLGRRGVFDGTVQNMHLNWKHRELAKILVKGKSFAQVKHIAISLEAESGGVLISLDKTTKGYTIVLYRGKNYQRPNILRPKNLLTRRQALARAIELQRREALNHHISNLHERIQMLKSQLDKMEADKELGNEHLDIKRDDTFHSEDDMEDEGEEAYLETYSSGNEDGDDASIDEF